MSNVCGTGGYLSAPIGNGWLPPQGGAIPTIDDIIRELTGKIDASDLAISLKTEIETIAVVRQSLLAEIALRINDNGVLQGILADVDRGISDALTYMYNETQERVTADSAALSAFNVMAAAVAGSIASQSSSLDLLAQEDLAIAQSVDELAVQISDPVTGLAATRASLVNDYYTKATVDGAIGQTKTQLRAYSNLGSKNFRQNTAPVNRGNDPETGAAVPLLIGDTWINTTSSANTLMVWSGTAWDISKDSGIAAVDARVSTVETSKIGYCSIGVSGVPTDHKDRETCQAAGNTWNVGLPLASAVKQVTVSDPNGGTAKLETAMSAQKTLNDGMKAQYTVKLNSNGMIGGFGLYNDATGVSAGFDVDSFWIGRTDATKVKPFIIENNKVFISSAFISSLTVDKLTTNTGGVLIQDGIIRIGSGIQDGATRNFNKGVWTANTAYTPGDSVVFEGNSWECRVLHTSSTSIKPPTYPTSINTQWNLLTVRGQGQVTGVAFIRSNASTVPTPTGGSFTSPTPTTAGWDDGIPADNNMPLWMSTCLFTSDSQSPQVGVNGTWTTPSKVASPSLISRPVFSVLGTNASIGTTDATWHITPALPDVFMATQAGVNGDFTNGAITGSVKIKGESGINSAVVYAYKRSATVLLATDNPGAIQYTFATNTISSPATLANGWQRTIPGGDTPLYVVAATASLNTAVDSIASNEWTAPVQMSSSGLNAATVYMYRRTTTNVAPTISGGSITYNFTTPPSITGAYPTGWFKDPPSTGGDFLWVSTATAASTSASDVISSSEWAAASLLASNGKVGTSMDVQYSVDNINWGNSPTGAKYIRTGTKADGATVFTYSAGVKFVPELGTEYTVTNGTSAYLHIKYSNNGTSFTGNGGEDVGTWLGQYSDTVAADSTNFNDYKFTKIQGEKPVLGVDYTVKNGIDGLINTNLSYVLGQEGGFYTGTLARSGSAGSAWAVTGTGVTMTGNGIAAAKGGVPTFVLNGSTGDAVFAGNLSAASGTLGSLVVTEGGFIRSGQTAYHTGNGFFLGNLGSTPVFSIGNSAGAHLRWDGTTLHINGHTSDSFTAPALTNFTGTVYGLGNPIVYGSRTAAPSGGRAPYKYVWILQHNSTSSGTYMYINGSNTDATVSVGGFGDQNTVSGTAICFISDANNRVAVTSFLINAFHSA